MYEMDVTIRSITNLTCFDDIILDSSMDGGDFYYFPGRKINTS